MRKSEGENFTLVTSQNSITSHIAIKHDICLGHFLIARF